MFKYVFKFVRNCYTNLLNLLSQSNNTIIEYNLLIMYQIEHIYGLPYRNPSTTLLFQYHEFKVEPILMPNQQSFNGNKVLMQWKIYRAF